MDIKDLRKRYLKFFSDLVETESAFEENKKRWVGKPARLVDSVNAVKQHATVQHLQIKDRVH